MPLNFLSLTSGGKDSHLSSLLAQSPPYNHNCIGYVHVAPPRTEENESEEIEEEDRNSHMFQSACSTIVVNTLSTCTGRPVYVLRARPTTTTSTTTTSTSTAKTYIPTSKYDEIEILYTFLLHLSNTIDNPKPNALCSGATLSTYQRTRVESITARLNWTSLAPLWRLPPRRILELCDEKGIEAVVVKVATMGCDSSDIGTNLSQIAEKISKVKCGGMVGGGSVVGEGGEYVSSLTITCCFEKKTLTLSLQQTKQVRNPCPKLPRFYSRAC